MEILAEWIYFFPMIIAFCNSKLNMESLTDLSLYNALTYNPGTIISGTSIMASKTATRNKNKNTKKVSFACFACSETFTVEIDFEGLKRRGKNVPIELDVVCPCCGLKGRITMKMAGTWSCEYCGKKFPAKKEAEFHEESCECNKLQGSV
jgi:hypothetical protein